MANDKVKLINELGHDFTGPTKGRSTIYQDGVIYQTNAGGISLNVHRNPDKKSQTKSFWVARKCSRFVVANAVSKSDEKEPHISGLAFLPDGQLIACDKNNTNIKLFSCEFIMIYELCVRKRPFDIAVIDQKKAVVSFRDEKQLQFVVLKPGIKLDRKLHVRGTCFGLTVHKSQIYVCTVEHETREQKEDGKEKVTPRFRGIDVYSLKGKLLYSISHHGHGYAKFVCVNDHGTKIYYTGGEGKNAFVACVTRDGHLIFRFSDEKLEWPVGIALDKYENVITGELKNGLLYVINSVSKRRQYLFDEEDHTRISAVAYNAEDGVLVMGRFSTLNAYYLLKSDNEINDAYYLRKPEKKKETVNDNTKRKTTKACCVLL